MQPHSIKVLPLVACVVLSLGGAANAETSPYYIGASQALTYQTNVFSQPDYVPRLDSGISTTSIIGGFDQPIGRQRIYANGNFGYNYFTNESIRYLNNNSYGLSAGIDWETVERLSGTVRLLANQSLANYATASSVPTTVKNVQNVGTASVLAHYGITPRVTLDAGYDFNYLNYSASSSAYQEYKQNVYSLGLRYGHSGVLNVGLGLRLQKTDYPNYIRNPVSDDYIADDATGKNVDLNVSWVPSGLSSLDARLSFTDISYTINTGADYHGLTGALGWNYKVSGKLSTRLAFQVVPGSGATYLAYVQEGPGSIPVATPVENSQLSKILRVSATYAATGKTTLSGNISLVQNEYGQSTILGKQYGSDLTPSITLGVSYAPTRNSLLGCSVFYQKRSASDTAIATGQSYDYDNGYFRCSGQLTLQ